MVFSRQEYWSGLPFPSPMDHILSELSTMTRPSWVALHGIAHSFIELDKAVVHVIRSVSFLWLWFSVWWRRIRGLWKLPHGIDWLRGKLGLVLMGMALFSKSLTNFLLMHGAVFLTCCLTWGYGGGNEDNVDLLQKVPRMHCCTQCPQPCNRPLLTHASTGDAWTLTGKSGSVS